MALVKRRIQQPVAGDERRRERDEVGLKDQLGDANPVARRWAARDLASFEQAAHALVAQLRRETDAPVREAILMSLAEIGSAQAVQGLVECLRSQDAGLRNEAIEAMKNLPEAVAPIMAGLLSDPDADVRIFAVNILESLRHPEVENWLIKVISEDDHLNVCATAVDLLGEVGTEAAMGPLEALKVRFPQEPYITFAADLALKRIRGS